MTIGFIVAPGLGETKPIIGALYGAAFAGLVVGLEAMLKGFTIRGFSSGTFGLMIGIFCAWLLTRIGIFDLIFTDGTENHEAYRSVYHLCLYAGLGFLGAALALRTNTEEFSFIIPYVRFRRESDMDQPLLVDTNIIIDGRIPRLCETGFLSADFIVPRFIVDELHVLADSPDQIKRERGRRGLDGLDEMRGSDEIHVSVHEDFMASEKLVDQKLVALARQLGAKILTNDANLGKVARLRNVPVLNLNDLARALRPVVNAGDELQLNLIKEGKDDHQAVGYLQDGTMIVVNKAVKHIGSARDVVISSSLQTSAGRLVFAELKENAEA